MSSEADSPVIQIALFASGRGSNAERIIAHFSGHPSIRVALVVTNKKEAGVRTIAEQAKIPHVLIPKTALQDPDVLLNTLSNHNIHFIALAGFLLLIPEFLIRAYPGRIVNIHPALLPGFGGKGMYGIHVHRAVKNAGVERTGMTVHHVNPVYDDGQIIFQATVPISPADEPEDIARKVLVLEHRYYAPVIESMITLSSQAGPVP